MPEMAEEDAKRIFGKHAGPSMQESAEGALPDIFIRFEDAKTRIMKRILFLHRSRTYKNGIKTFLGRNLRTQPWTLDTVNLVHACITQSTLISLCFVRQIPKFIPKTFRDHDETTDRKEQMTEST